MKIGKLVLAAVSAAVAVGLLGAGTAAAELCSTNTSPCSGTVYAPGTEVHMTLKAGSNVVLNTNLGTITCTSGTIKGKTTSHFFGSDTLDIESIVDGTCTSGGSGCTVTTSGLPTGSEIVATGGGNGSMTITSFSMKTECSGGLLNCTFSASKVKLGFTGGIPATLTAKELALTVTGGFCSAGSLSATYSFTTPKSAFEI